MCGSGSGLMVIFHLGQKGLSALNNKTILSIFREQRFGIGGTHRDNLKIRLLQLFFSKSNAIFFTKGF